MEKFLSGGFFFCLKGPRSENFKNSYYLSEMANFEHDFCFESLKCLKKLKIVKEESMAKSKKRRKLATFLTPFSGKQHQNLFTSEIVPLD